MNTPFLAITLLEAWNVGGYLMWVLAGMSILGVALCLYFMASLRLGAVVPMRLHRDLVIALAQDDLTDARRLCEHKSSAMSAVILTTLDAIRSAPTADAAMIAKVAESEGAYQASQLRGQIQWLLDIATIAPMVGLLGTVMGMLDAFGAVAADIAAAKPTLLAEGVSKAIITTIFGLMIAIPAMTFYAMFRRRAVRLIAALESASAELIAVLTGKHMKD